MVSSLTNRCILHESINNTQGPISRSNIWLIVCACLTCLWLVRSTLVFVMWLKVLCTRLCRMKQVASIGCVIKHGSRGVKGEKAYKPPEWSLKLKSSCFNHMTFLAETRLNFNKVLSGSRTIPRTVLQPIVKQSETLSQYWHGDNQVPHQGCCLVGMQRERAVLCL